MPIVSLIAIYFVTWWICLFAVLPIGVPNQAEADDVAGSELGAPKRPALLMKMGITTIVAAVVVALLYWLLSNPIIQEYWR